MVVVIALTAVRSPEQVEDLYQSIPHESGASSYCLGGRVPRNRPPVVGVHAPAGAPPLVGGGPP
jgi:hypothetical protein